MNDHPAARPPLHLPPEFRHLWLLFIVVGIVNLIILGRQFQRRGAERPDLAEGYRRYLVGLAAYFLLPWLAMGAGIEVGGVPNVFSFLSLHDRNPYVIAFYTVITAMLALGCNWIFLRRGAEFLLKHPGILRNPPKSPLVIRAFCAFMMVFWLVMLALRWIDVLPVPPIR